MLVPATLFEPFTVRLAVEAMVREVAVCTSIDLPTAAVPPKMVGLFALLGITTSSVAVGMVPSAQLPDVAQSADTQPVQVSVVVEAVNGEVSTTGLLA